MFSINIKRVYNTQSDRIIEITVKQYIHLAKVTKRISTGGILECTLNPGTQQVMTRKSSMARQKHSEGHAVCSFVSLTVYCWPGDQDDSLSRKVPTG